MDINNFDKNQEIAKDLPDKNKNIKKRNKKIFFISFLVFVLVLVGSGGFAYYFYNNYYLNPERIIKRVFNNLNNINSFSYDGEIKTEVSYLQDLDNDFLSIDNASFTFEMFLNGNFIQEKDKSNLKNELNLISKVGFITDGLNFSFDLDLDAKNNKEEFYLKLNQFPPIPILPLDNIKNKWIKFDIKEDFKEKEIEEEYEKQKEFFDSIQKEFLKGDIIKITEVFPNKNINGINLYHYGFNLNREELDRILDIVFEKDSDYTKEEIQKIKESFQSFNINNGEIFIGKKDFLPYKISFNTYLNSEDFSFQSTDVIFEFNNFNKDLKINFPEDSYSIEEIFMKMSEEMTF